MLKRFNIPITSRTIKAAIKGLKRVAINQLVADVKEMIATKGFLSIKIVKQSLSSLYDLLEAFEKKTVA